jgi:Holliday junction resolvase RusA-like endonuclease
MGDSRKWVFFVPGLPVAQPRHRVSAGISGGRPRAWLPSDHPVHAFKAAVMAAVREHGPQACIDGPVELGVSLLFQRPASHFGSGKNADRLKPSAPAFHVQKPDADNVVKAIKDACTRAGAWRDDSQVWSLRVVKAWCVEGEMPGCEIHIGFSDC